MVSRTGMAVCSRIISWCNGFKICIVNNFFCRSPSDSKKKNDWIQERLDNLYSEALGVNDEAIADAYLRKKRKGKEHAVARTGVGEVRKAAKESFAGPKKAIGETSKC